jgi:large subunit ribosomal protein L23
MDIDTVIINPLSTEKSLRMMEAENKLIFLVQRKATREEISKAVEKAFNAKVLSVNTLIRNGKKRAYVQFSPETPAIDIATNLGLM